jgi:hypothetical protein
MDVDERQHLLQRIDELDRARRRWKLLALVGTPALAVLLLLAAANVITSALTLLDVKTRQRQAADDALRAAEEALQQRDVAQQAMEEARLAMARQDKPLSLSLEVVDKEIKSGTTPQFRLTVTNTSNEEEKVLDIRGRSDLQHTYYDLEVTKDGKSVDLPRAISDPGPISDREFLSLAPGASVTFVLSSFPMSLNALPPGNYQASVRFWQNPYRSHQTAYNSPDVTFAVEK